MKRGKRILLAIGCIMLLGLSWLAAVTAKTDAQRQEELMAQAAAYVEDEIYIRAVPLLEEAAAYEDAHTLEAEEALKNVYLHLIEKSGYPQKYTGLKYFRRRLSITWQRGRPAQRLPFSGPARS